MKKQKLSFIGVDISKDTLDICVIYPDNSIIHTKIKNAYLEIYSYFAPFKFINSKIVFENTGVYYYAFARVLEQLELDYTILNPNRISHYLKYVSNEKTDKVDSTSLAEYASVYHKELKKSKFDDSEKKIKSFQTALALLTKTKTQLSNFSKTLDYVDNSNLNNHISNLINDIDENKIEIEKEIFHAICEIIPNTEKIIEENKGFGTSLAVYLFPILHANRDKTHKQISSFLGLAPMKYESGSSVYKIPKITHKGDSEVRKVLFMTALVCVRYNEIFKTKYEAMLSKGKPKKVALIAICNKIIKYLKEKYFNE